MTLAVIAALVSQWRWAVRSEVEARGQSRAKLGLGQVEALEQVVWPEQALQLCGQEALRARSRDRDCPWQMSSACDLGDPESGGEGSCCIQGPVGCSKNSRKH